MEDVLTLVFLLIFEKVAYGWLNGYPWVSVRTGMEEGAFSFTSLRTFQFGFDTKFYTIFPPKEFHYKLWLVRCLVEQFCT